MSSQGTPRGLPITAVAVRCAIGDDEDTVLDALRTGRSGLEPLSEGLAAPTWFGPTRAALPPVDGPHDTRQGRLCAALVDDLAAPIAAAVARWGADRVGVALGSTTCGMADTEVAWPAWQATPPTPEQRRAWLLDKHLLAASTAVIVARSGARGPAIVQSSACASSAKVLGTARRWIEAGLVDAVLCAGVDTACRFTVLGFGSLGILSRAPTRPFAADRDGINLGEAGALLLVERDGPARARLLGVGETSDAFHITQPRPDGSGLAAAMREALAQAGLPPDAVDLVNAHATGTPANDAAEAAALAEVLPHGPWVCATKALTGHTLGAAGGLEAALTVLCLEHGVVPVTRTGPRDPALPPLRLAEAPVSAPLRVALSTSAAFGGHNAAVLLGAP